MAKELLKIIDVQKLEEEVCLSARQERIYELQNQAKIRAASDKSLTSYEEFRDRVDAAHLVPIDPRGKCEELRSWNQVARVCLDPRMESESNAAEMRRPPQERYAALRSSGADELMATTRELPVGALGDVVEALHTFPNTTEDILFVVSVLEKMAKTERFRLGLDFLTCTEKNLVWSLMDKISKSFNNRHQDLADQGVTEWTVQGLREKYCVPGKRPTD